MNPSPNEQNEVDWHFLGEIEIWRTAVRSQDLITPDVRYDTVRLGYWVRTDSPTYTLLALKGCRYSKSWGQHNW